MATQRVILTYKDYEALPADGRRYELHEGELSVTPAPSPRHQRLLGNLYMLLGQHVNASGAGELFFAPIDCILSDTTIVQPELVFLDATRLSAVSTRGIEGPPTLVVEVLSPTTTLIDRSTKLQLYARHGVPYYWIADPEQQTIEVYNLAGAGYDLATRATGADAVSLPPFSDLAFVPSSLWR